MKGRTDDRRPTNDQRRTTNDERSWITFYVLRFRHYAPLIVLVILALGLRLLVWRWHAPYPLGGDESGYFNQALTLLREHRYDELKLMRPPLYTAFLAVCILLFDSLVQRLRLIQEIISALTVVPIYALTRRLFGDSRIAFVAGLLVAANYTLAANATELLTETLFLFGLTTLFWLLLKAGEPTTDDERRTTDDGRRPYHPSPIVYAALAGLALGALALLRSVAFPLLPLGALWLLQRQKAKGKGQKRWPIVLPALLFTFAFCLLIMPWTIRNQLTYGAPILVDTTGPENLWLDNDPAGREVVKQQLYQLGDDRAARQRIALERGTAAISADPRRFFAKACGEAQKFFALQYFDDMRDRRAIWVPPLEVWLRLLLGDGLWIVMVLGGVMGLWLAPTNDQGRRTNASPGSEDRGSKIVAPRFSIPARSSVVGGRWSMVGGSHWLFVPWALYTLLTALIFHVELRYRLPLYPVLLPYAAWTITRILDFRLQILDLKSTQSKIALSALTCLLLIGLMLAHRPYIGETWMLAWKHARLWQAERALASGDARGARSAAQAALVWDGDSALARVALARAALLEGDRRAALDALDAAIAALRAHPYAHLLRGGILREQGDDEEARKELAFESNSLEDLQDWAWRTFAPVARTSAAADVGGGFDLGFVRGFSLPENGAFRWSSAVSQVQLLAPSVAARLDLRLASGRPPGAPPATLIVSADGREIGRIQLTGGWRTYSLPLARPAGPLVLTLSGDTFRPRDYDRTSPDDRALGVMVSRVEIITP
ncbi:MAG TPA: glycosyltransferase family 39 protein [Roseiflexaceae bacterium]